MNQIRVDAVAAIGKHRIAHHHLQRRDRARTQRHGQVGRVAFSIEAKTGDPLLRILGTHRLQDTDGDHVFRFGQGGAQRHGAFKLAVVVLGLPRLAAGDAGIKEQRGIVDDGRGREAFFQSRRVNEGLEARARLAPGLGDVVELVLVEVKAADQGANGAIARVDGDKRTLDLGQLRDFPRVLRCLDDTDEGAGPQLDVGRCFVGQARLHGLEAIAGDLQHFAVLAHGAHFARRGFQHHRGQQVAFVALVDQGIVNRVFEFARVGRQVDEALGAAVVLPQLIVHDAAAQRLVGHFLVVGAHRGVNIQAARVNLGTVLREHELACHLGHVIGMGLRAGGGVADFQLFFFGRFRLGLGDEVVFQHALDDVELARARTLGVVDGVVGRRRFGQAGEHGRLGNADVFQRLAEVRFSGRGKAIGALAQVNLVQVNLEDLVFAQQVLELEGQQHFVNFAGEGFFGRQVDIARHLHGDGGRALAFGAPEVGDAGAQEADVVHAAVLVKARVLNGQDRVFHHLRNVFEGREVAPLFAKFANLLAFYRVDAHRQLGAVVGQIGHIWQLRVGHGQGQADQQHPGHASGGGQAKSPQEKAGQQAAQVRAGWRWQGRRWRGRFGRGWAWHRRLSGADSTGK